MFDIGEYIIYGKSGVCEVKDISHPDMLGLDPARVYYTLVPVGTTETIFTPVDTTVFMRKAISREAAIELIHSIPEIEDSIDVPESVSGKALPAMYDELIQTHTCEDLVKLIVIVYSRTKRAHEAKRRMTQTDQAYMKNAEDMLYGELSVALGIPKEGMADYIAAEIAALK